MLEPQDQIPWYVWILVAFIIVAFAFFAVHLAEYYGGTALMTNKTNQKKSVQKTTQTRKNTVESPKSAQFFSAESSRLTDFSTPVYNMRVTID